MCTHLHVDHCGWDIRLLDGRWVPTFPNAKYVFSKAEYEHWRGPAGKEGVNAGVYQDSVLPVIESGQAEIVDGEDAVGDRLMLHPTLGQTVGHVAIKLRSGSSVGTLCISRCRCSVPAGIARFAKIRCEPGTRAVGCLSARPRRCRGFNSRNGRRSSSKELPGGAVNVHPPNNAYPRIGRAGPGLAGPGKSSPWISSRQ